MAPSEISLRALRTSCKSLAAYAGERSCGVSATYSSRPTSSSPPLSVLPPPDSRAYYDRSLCEQRELSRKIYAVRDAYNSVLTRTRDDEAPAPRVMTLADMCAAVAGRGLEYQPEDEDDALDWNEERDEIYEAIPPPYRRCVPFLVQPWSPTDVRVAERLSARKRWILSLRNAHTTPLCFPYYSMQPWSTV